MGRRRRRRGRGRRRRRRRRRMREFDEFDVVTRHVYEGLPRV
jgi:hypothetical protein